MAFGIGTNTQKADSGPVRGKQKEIACQCWFTSKGKITPLMLKIQDADPGTFPGRKDVCGGSVR